LVAENVAQQIERRVNFRRAMKKAMSACMMKGADGIKVQCRGRRGGSEIARTEGYKEGKVPLSTFRANIDYGFIAARTTYGVIGVKVWVYTEQDLNVEEDNDSGDGSGTKKRVDKKFRKKGEKKAEYKTQKQEPELKKEVKEIKKAEKKETEKETTEKK